MNISGKNILLTGAARIGKTVAYRLAERGANISIAYRSSKNEADEIISDVSKFGVKTLAIQADVSKEEDIKMLVEKTLLEFGSIEGVVHMASPYPATPIGEITMDKFSSIMITIAGSAALLGQEAGLKMKDGKIIFFSDWSVLRAPGEDYLVYNAAKAAIDSITKTLAIKLAPKISVNAIAPGPILKPPDLTDEDDKIVLARTPLKRWGGPEEIAKAVLYLFDSDFTTGVILPVDGGRSIA